MYHVRITKYDDGHLKNNNLIEMCQLLTLEACFEFTLNVVLVEKIEQILK